MSFSEGFLQTNITPSGLKPERVILSCERNDIKHPLAKQALE